MIWLKKIRSKKIDLDVVIASPNAMHIVSQLGQILGPRGLMPNLKNGTITTDVEKEIKNFKKGKICYRNDKNGIVHTSIGKINFELLHLKDNLETLLSALKKDKPTIVKGVYFKKITLSTTMSGIGISIDKNTLLTCLS